MCSNTCIVQCAATSAMCSNKLKSGSVDTRCRCETKEYICISYIYFLHHTDLNVDPIPSYIDKTLIFKTQYIPT